MPLSRAWVFQDARQKQKLGDDAPWSVGWYYRKVRRSKTLGSLKDAKTFARRKEGELAASVEHARRRVSWKVFRAEYEESMATTRATTRSAIKIALDHFERIIAPGKVCDISTTMIDRYKGARSKERGQKKGTTVAVPTINKELRMVKAALNVAHDWDCLAKVPKVKMLREPKKLARIVTGDHFTKIYGACDAATFPRDLPYPAAEWWRSLLMFLYMTGWRIGETLALRRCDLDLKAGCATTRHDDNKAGRDEKVKLHDVVIDHLERIPSVEPMVWPWYHGEITLWREFARIQEAGGVRLACDEAHEHTDACHAYGFHDLRRAFATVNVDKLSAQQLQTLMRHKSYSTTQRYIAMASDLSEAVAGLTVPTLPKPKVEIKLAKIDPERRRPKGKAAG